MAPARGTRGGLGGCVEMGGATRWTIRRRKLVPLTQMGAHIGRMAREKYESLLRCPMCGRTGLADMSDDKSHKVGDYDTRVEAVTQGFEIKGKDVICSACQVSAL
jgi:hypothetical protein